MNFYIIGINYKTTSRYNREKACKLRGEIEEFLKGINIGFASLFNSCNRTEIHGLISNNDSLLQVFNSLKKHFNEIFDNAYIIYGEEDVFRYALRLASGLESQIKGEAQILKQLEEWKGGNGAPKILKSFWDQIIKKAKMVRDVSGINEHSISIADILLRDFKTKTKLNRKPNILILGTGKIAEIVAKSFKDLAYLIFVSRKKKKKAKRIARIAGGALMSRDDLLSVVKNADIIIGATSSTHYVLNSRHFSNVSGVLKKIYIYDLSIPSDVSPEVRVLPFVRYKNLDDLQLKLSDVSLELYKSIESAEKIIELKILKRKGVRYDKDYTLRYTPQPACA